MDSTRVEKYRVPRLNLRVGSGVYHTFAKRCANPADKSNFKPG
jgi:hypothetical protein